MLARRYAVILAGFTAGLIGLIPLTRRSESAPTPASQSKAMFLVRFGMDGKQGVDWSGESMREQTGSTAGNSTREIGVEARWKCATEEERYWDTPYEARMRSTSHRDKVTQKGVRSSTKGTAESEIRRLHAARRFQFPG